MSIALWVVGEPGCGKTTLVRELLGPNIEINERPKWTWNERGVCAAGHYVGHPFDGADRVPYNGVASALRFWDAKLSSSELTVFDGDRFSNAAAVAWAKGHPAIRQTGKVLLELDEVSARRRRMQRGTVQNASWVKGRKTKAARFGADLDGECVIDATLPVDEQVQVIVNQFLVELIRSMT